jgi:hypothetical protein
MSPPIFEPVIPESSQPQSHTLDRAANGMGRKVIMLGLLYHAFNTGIVSELFAQIERRHVHVNEG